MSKYAFGFLLYGLLLTAALADNNNAPVEHVISPPAQTLSSGSEERLTHLEQQTKNWADMDFPGQINALQEQVKKLQGTVDAQQEELKSVKTQNRAFYEDFNQRMTQLKNLEIGDNPSQTALQSAALPADASISMKDSTDYRAAVSWVSKKQYDKAQAAFKSYLNSYPNGAYVSDAHYWLGEIYLSQKAKERAVPEFLTVVNQFPQSHKAGAAHLKLGMTYADMGKLPESQRELLLVKQQNPGSVLAQLATIRLQQIKEIESQQAKANPKSVPVKADHS